jgi:hypothetical protein
MEDQERSDQRRRLALDENVWAKGRNKKRL